MPTLTLAIPEELKKEMDELPELNWSEIARRAIAEKAAEYKLFKTIVEKSKYTDRDASQLGYKISDAIYKGYKKKQ